MEAQNLSDSINTRIDGIFRSFTSTTPGCAVAIIKNSTVIFQKGYGQANLEYSIPIVPTTIFHIASESKQYVAFCMLLLEKEGKLSIDDDIRKYLDYVPDFKHPITIRHLITHTSGLRDQWQLLANAGWQLDDVITRDHVVKLVSNQKALNFIPGDEWMYCNTGYTLMAEIVTKVSGLSLREYADKNIFQPLGMADTHFHDDYQEIVPGRAYSYNLLPGKGFRHAVLSYSIVGATSLLTTVVDEAKWLNNFESGAVGGKDLIEKMYQYGVLNDGRKLAYAFGIRNSKYKGWEQIGHGGSDAGFRTFACRFPEKGLGIVVFSNSGAADAFFLTNQVANLLITDNKEETKTEDQKVFADSTIIKKLQGRFYSERGDITEMIWQKGKLYRAIPVTGATSEIKLTTAGNNRYNMPGSRVLILEDKYKLEDSINDIRIENSNGTIAYKRQRGAPQKITPEFAGKYYGEETEAFYHIRENKGQLTLAHRKYPDVLLINIAPDQFTTPHWWMNHIRFLRNKKSKIIGFEVNSGRIQHLRYDRKPG